MIYDKIFWIEDCPEVLANIFQELPTAIQQILARITFAHDLEEGLEKTAQESFDLYILDADFPDRIPPLRREEINSVLSNYATGFWDREQMFRKMRHRYDSANPRTNNFVPLYRARLVGKPTIVYSISTIAPEVAYSHGLPFYSKAKLTPSDIKELVLEGIVLASKHPCLGSKRPEICTWECGGREDFIKQYLLR